MSQFVAKRWLRRSLFAFAGLAVVVNLGFMALEVARVGFDQDLDDAETALVDGDVDMPPASEQAVSDTNATSAAGDVMDLNLIEPAAGDDVGTPEYFGDGDVPLEDRGLASPEIRVSGMTTFQELNDVVELLRQRRQDLVRREDQLEFRDQVLQEREAKVEAALVQLEALRAEIDALIEKKSEDEEREMARLVKVYESMKAKSAATIFNTLDIDVLIDVAARMREAKFAVILQNMDPKRAEVVTERLADRLPLPEAVRPPAR